jgi:hypothetical protein
MPQDRIHPSSRARRKLNRLLFGRRPTLAFTLALTALLHFTLYYISSFLDPLEHLVFMMHQHLTESGLGRLNQGPVAFGGLTPCFHVIPHTMRVGHIDK